jgi:hypothetical protein
MAKWKAPSIQSIFSFHGKCSPFSDVVRNNREYSCRRVSKKKDFGKLKRALQSCPQLMVAGDDMRAPSEWLLQRGAGDRENVIRQTLKA